MHLRISGSAWGKQRGVVATRSPKDYVKRVAPVWSPCDALQDVTNACQTLSCVHQSPVCSCLRSAQSRSGTPVLCSGDTPSCARGFSGKTRLLSLLVTTLDSSPLGDESSTSHAHSIRHSSSDDVLRPVSHPPSPKPASRFQGKNCCGKRPKYVDSPQGFRRVRPARARHPSPQQACPEIVRQPDASVPDSFEKRCAGS